ncbi:hypothetical protein [Sneathiella aquimaris]|uniref:hypothetical protein n=1 Tax=Sneathiella aquimaris TaxID=2599305 RepID=UPI00146CB46A|nr:hypothetical protein [Sneathiella aquimaris]
MKVLALISGLLLFSSTVQAAVLDFSGVTDIGPSHTSYVEKGVTVQSIGGDLAYHGTPGRVHITDSGTSFATGLSFTTGARFDAVQFDIFGSSNFFCLGPGCNSPIPFNNVVVTAERSGVEVARREFYSGTSPHTEVLDFFFLDIDRLSISILFPAAVDDTVCAFAAPCTFFDVDNVLLIPNGNISSVPLPAALPLYGAGLLMVGFLGNRARRRNEKSIN